MLGIVVLIGWQIHSRALVQVVPTLPPMYRMTALSFVLNGVALLLLNTGHKRAAAFLARVTLLLVILVCLEYALGTNFGIDEFLGPDYITTFIPGRMSPVSALCFVGASLAVIAAASRRPAESALAIAGVLGSMIAAVGTVSVLGYLLVHMQPYDWYAAKRMALHSSAAFALLGYGLMAWAWNKSREQEGTPEWLPLSVGLGLGAAAVGMWHALTAREASELHLISGVILAGGILGSVLVAFAVFQAQRAQKRSREIAAGSVMLQQLFETAPQGLIMTDVAGNILMANRHAERIFGFTHDELPGSSLEELIPVKLRDYGIGRNKEDRTRFNASMPHELALNGRRRDGSQFPAEVSLTPLSPGNKAVVLALVQDVTERKKAEDVLRQSEERFRSLFEQGPMGVALVGTDGRMFKANAVFCQMLGYSEDEMTQMTPVEITHPEDQEITKLLMEQLLKKKIPIGRIEKRYIKKNGEVMWASLSTSLISDREGNPLYSVGLVADITQRKRVEAELRLDSEIFSTMEEGVCLVRLDDAVVVHTNPKFEKMFGYDENELVGKHISLINAPTHKSPEELAEEIRQELRRSGVWRGEILHQRRDGTHFWCAVTVSTFHHPEFGLVGVSIHQDITDLKEARETLRASEERFRGIFEQGPIGVALLDGDHRMSKTNPALCRMLGYSEAELATMTPIDMTHPDDRKHCLKLLQELDRAEVPFCKMEKRYIKKNGDVMWASLTASVIRDHEGKPLHGLGLVEDITEHRQADEKMAEQAALLGLAHDAIIVRDLDGRIRFWNRGAEDTYGWPASETLGNVIHQLLHTSFPIAFSEIEAAVLTHGGWEGELQHTTRDGRTLVLASRWSLQRDEHGEPRAILEINRDMTERKRTEEELRSLTERLSLAIRSASIGVWDWNLDTNTTVWDETIFAMFGIPKVVPMAYEKFTQRVHPEDLPKVQASLERAIQGRTQDFVEFRIIRTDGSVRHIYSASGAVLDEHGRVVRVVGTAVDITERKQMEAQIEASKVQLVASARLSALGMMAGGVAHEINNPLGIIHALASDLRDMVEEEGAAPPEIVARNSARIRETADRIAQIVKSLRQISREGSRDTLHPAQVSHVVEATLAICRERFRANAVELMLPQSLPDLSVPCREVQIEQILLNLLQNAFDAVAEQPVEKWVRLDVSLSEESVIFSVTDNGPGIPEELRPHIMEPFFTTKPVGKGTGLGLSLSKTIAEEHGGKLEYSEDHGHTRFSLILPLAREAAVAWS
ncbi:MAG TPA: PAS domain S-box protein [Candidatus Angelobacter sp.]